MATTTSATGSLPPPGGVTPEWTEDHLPGVFARGHRWIVRFSEVTSNAVIEATGVEPGDRVIDIGCGSGIPTLMLAQRVGPEGHVTAVDPSPVLLGALRINVTEAGLSNVEIAQASAATLPYPDGIFDAATCHFGAMFFPDLTAGLTSNRRVLRPGARAAFAGWGPIEDNTHLKPLFEILARHLGPSPVPENPKEAPWPMRFAEAGILAAALEAAGFADVREDQPVVRMTWPGPPATLLTFWMEMVNRGPDVPAGPRSDIERDILQVLGGVEDSDGLQFTARVTFGSGIAPA